MTYKSGGHWLCQFTEKDLVTAEGMMYIILLSYYHNIIIIHVQHKMIMAF